MADRDVAEQVIEQYLDAVDARLVGPRSARTAIIDELRDGLREAGAAWRSRGAESQAAIRQALREFGPPAALAAGFAGELATRRARVVAAAYLATGPAVGIAWLLLLALPGPGVAVPQAMPMIAVAVLAGVLVLAATGRTGLRRRPCERLVLHGSLVVVVAAAVGDLLMLVVAITSVPAATTPVPLVLAIAASTVRLASGAVAGARCLHSRRSLTAT